MLEEQNVVDTSTESGVMFSPIIDAAPTVEKTHVVLGICAMEKKSHSIPMEQILDRIRKTILVQVIIFSEDTILNKPIEDWPSCDAFMSFYSTGFPLSKAIEYADKYQPFLINDLRMQYTLLDRVDVYQTLEEAGIEIPRYAVLRRDGTKTDEKLGLTEEADSIDINGVTFQKPFVEKPLHAEDHRVHIYYPTSAGGGQTQLFRKVKDRSSIFITDSKIRRTGSYIYEEFIRTNGADVKVYSIGPDYAHAEARKSPSLDGKVDRDQYGKEVRFPVMLTATEKAIAKTIAITFRHNVCGFDLLRTKGKMYVCDVNGFSFVKSSPKYFDDAGVLLTSIILENQAPYLINEIPRIVSGHQDKPIKLQQPTININNKSDELRCVIAVMRHGDRNPKQKIKLVISHPRFTELFSKKVNKKNQDSIKLKKPKHLQEFLDLIKEVLNRQEEESVIASKAKELNQMKIVLEMYGKFSGINRKIQMKRQLKKGNQDPNSHSFLLILKWGGELTKTGKAQAEELGRYFRLRYPGDHENYNSILGSGFLRLHSTYRHDLKIYASDEGRVQMTAAAFVKGMLELEGSLPSTLVHLVKCDDDSTSLLDTSSNDNIIMANAKNRLHQVMKTNQIFNDGMIEQLASTRSPSLLAAIKRIGNPYDQCIKVNRRVHSLVKHLEELRESSLEDGRRLEVLEMMIQRWQKLKKDFYDLKSNTFDISKIPDLYDCIKYDIMHNKEYLFKDAAKLHNKSKALADIIIPQEYGITVDEKIRIAQTICNPLLKKIVSDFLHIENNSYAEQECFHLLNPK
ncbi:Inositol hexakisphosphate and diphosphoinositol-pentakisphosphate kinase 1 isoform X12 [Oopsacas minuta]|uniref:Inositol hexakisphosphate and diphosphoinositol-pentakisphosphate kinase n=1 Tax=Oopsacas minuta TaxID=111878 RepID=A0AAV7JHS8_9METZ|nr:Inositol hexakisphosphate and diphosphoinositol-pentakisphosphate kinase 1 isoform X12 [Oopsacas minuta]